MHSPSLATVIALTRLLAMLRDFLIRQSSLQRTNLTYLTVITSIDYIQENKFVLSALGSLSQNELVRLASQ